MELPHAEEIRSLRIVAEQGPRASTDLAELERVLTALSLGVDSRAPDQLALRLASEWPELEVNLGAGSFAALTQARRGLRELVAKADQAGRRLHSAMEHQWHALEREEWAEVRSELGELIGERSIAAATFNPLQAMHSALAPLCDAFEGQIATLESPPTAHDQHRLARLYQSVGPILARIGLERASPPAEGPEATELAVRYLDDLRRQLDEIASRRDAAAEEVARIEARIRARTG